ncbi:MAG: hypothetical protein K8S55_10155 [Phycisphaerae bacterium]|nr:hypothetical protein [Phycisphaerae bacterium]
MSLHKQNFRNIFTSLACGSGLTFLLYVVRCLLRWKIVNPINLQFLIVLIFAAAGSYILLGVIRDMRTKRNIRRLAQKQRETTLHSNAHDWHAAILSEKAKKPADTAEAPTAQLAEENR